MMTVGTDETDIDWLEEYGDAFSSMYIPKKVLGKGISSTVRQCSKRDTNEEFAVKIIDIINSKVDENQVEAIKEEYLNEVAILRKLTEPPGHPNIIHLHDFVETPTFLFMVFELCEGGELFDYLTKVVTTSEKRTRSIMRRIFEALDYVHSFNIVHRDMKPENILLDNDLNVKLSDFGMAVELEEGELLTELCGTPGYMSPEMLKCNMGLDSDGYSKEIDLWACGVIMYTLLAGFAPFWHRKKMMMIRYIMEGRYQFGSPEWDDISECAKDLISKLLTVDPKERITARRALEHEFFQQVEHWEGVFKPRRRFKAVVYIIIAVCSMRKFSVQQTIPVRIICNNPYGVKPIRKALDSCAFSIYSHWVKKGERQNRAALFENDLKVNFHRSESTGSNVSLTPTMLSPSESKEPVFF